MFEVCCRFPSQLKQQNHPTLDFHYLTCEVHIMHFIYTLTVTSSSHENYESIPPQKCYVLLYPSPISRISL